MLPVYVWIPTLRHSFSSHCFPGKVNDPVFSFTDLYGVKNAKFSHHNTHIRFQVRCGFTSQMQLNAIEKHEQNKWNIWNPVHLNTSLFFKVLSSKSGLFHSFFCGCCDSSHPLSWKLSLLIILSVTFLAFVSLLDFNQRKQQLFSITLCVVLGFFLFKTTQITVINYKIYSGEKANKAHEEEDFLLN